ncbi:MAG: radical SAM family heme chaperone HemW [Oscillospiraceae bacterium]
MNDGLYIHIPFCIRKCPYCDFYSMACNEDLMDKFTEHTVSLISNCNVELHPDTIYFGGGTPTALGEKRLGKILSIAMEHFNFECGEVTVEANPCTLDEDYLKSLLEMGFNRLSMGFQSGNDDELKLLGRLHDVYVAKNAYYMARKVGFPNISLDIMLGLPNQTVESAINSAKEIIALNPEHISAYLLKIEKGTKFDKLYKTTEDFEDKQAEIYEQICSLMKENGYIQYEISNFSKIGYESKHNNKYWKLDDYLGIGPSAHSKIGDKRFFMERDLNAYLKGESFEDLLIFDDYAGDFDEYVMLRLRLKDGINLEEAEKFYPNKTAELIKKAKPMIDLGYVIYDEKTLSLTTEGFLISNYIISRLI